MAIPNLDKVGKDFQKWWNLSGEWVEPPNLRRGGESGVQRIITPQGQLAYSKKQVHHIYRSLRYPFGRPTVLREYDAFKALDALAIPIPQLLYCGVAKDGKALFITKALVGFIDLDQWLTLYRAQYPTSVVEQLLTTLAHYTATMHLNRYQHGCLYGKHIFVKVIDDASRTIIEVALLDLEKVRRRSRASKSALHDIPKLKRHSVLTSQEWQYFINCYQAAFGDKLPSLQKLGHLS